MKNVLYYHAYLDDMYCWSPIIMEHLFQIDKSGLINALDDIRFSVITQNDDRTRSFVDLLKAYSQQHNTSMQVEFIKSRYANDDEMMEDVGSLTHNSDKAITETHTMIKMQKDSQNEDMNICYLHLKGVTGVKNLLMVPGRASKFKNKYYWRQLMNEGVIGRWKTCVEKLNEGYDVVAGDYLGGPAPCFRGNFFWTKSSYVRKLDDISDPNWWTNWKQRLKHSDPWLYNSAKRFGDERWICSHPEVKTFESVSYNGFYIDNDI